MSNRKQNKEQERYYVEVFKSVFEGFPNGEIIADENQEHRAGVLAHATIRPEGTAGTFTHLPPSLRDVTHSPRDRGRCPRLISIVAPQLPDGSFKEFVLDP